MFPTIYTQTYSNTRKLKIPWYLSNRYESHTERNVRIEDVASPNLARNSDMMASSSFDIATCRGVRASKRRIDLSPMFQHESHQTLITFINSFGQRRAVALRALTLAPSRSSVYTSSTSKRKDVVECHDKRRLTRLVLELESWCSSTKGFS